MVASNIAHLQTATPTELGARPEHDCGYPEAISELNTLNDHQTALEKLLCIQRTAEAIFAAIDVFAREVGLARGAPTDAADGAQDLLPILVYVIIKAKVQHLFANYNFIKAFEMGLLDCYPSSLGFYLTTFHVAIERVKVSRRWPFVRADDAAPE